MNKRLAALLFSSFLTVGFFALPAWSQQTNPPAQQQASANTLPSTFDLRTVNAVTPIKKQLGGTCWTHGTMASIESNLLISGKWKAMDMKGIPMCSEYHLDWWNGFNKEFNEDVDDPAKAKTGMTIHQGGDYRVAAAYISRGDGVVVIPEGVEITAWHKAAPKKEDPAYKKLYVRDIEWFTIDDSLNGIDLIKQRIMKEGGMGTCYASNKGSLSKEFIHYQPASSKSDPNHSVCIVGWDDNKITTEDAKKPPKAGAWLIKNSWGDKSGDHGYYWISYFDKHAARHPEMGAVSFRNIEPLSYSHIYYHDAHGWRDTIGQVSKAMNAFKATDREKIKAVSFYTAQHNVSYTVTVYSKFEGGKLDGEQVKQSGKCEFCGFHTIDLMAPVSIKENDKFYVCVELSAGGHPIDRTSNIPVLLEQPPVKDQPPTKVDPKSVDPKQDAKKGGQKKGGGQGKPIVLSKASPGESFYFDGYQWKDLYEYPLVNPDWAVKAGVNFNHSANFCMKALTVKAAP